MIAPLLVAGAIGAAIYYIVRGKHRTVIGADDAVETVREPYRVVVMPHGRGSTAFGTDREPVPASATAIERVVVTGGKRWVPLWDKKSIAHDNPARVDVYMKGDASPRVFTGVIDMVTVYGGTSTSASSRLAKRTPGHALNARR